MMLNLEKQFTFYGAYHHNPVNLAIHIVCVPVIMLCMFQLATNIGPQIPLAASLSLPNLPSNLGTISGLLYTVLYILMEPVAGSMLAPLLVSAAVFANYLTSTYGMTATYWCLGIQGVLWILQFIGHGVFEGRAPALLDNLVQAFFLAPFFVWLEVLFRLGYRPQLKARIDEAVSKEIAKLKDGRGGKR
ncbi:hypothetical protein PABG_00160 [Paracoccidioides brasiliensis Pb03]|uniref:DUF962 domain-containing protein n=2 Tax=Paracoccidioides brasiliensis TaxID=121759 RepID=C1G5V5_PARBD|nr:uncharacterized protein PADG_02560 [Paracoccidioides brasiliensis Pb18]EEH17597.1 hypothetical protein PABG_00160 [Paracoccidioides brasiliensis Pb03]EEH46462.1 hypothetical protein PADG_02560 [Paracoccidioides brasiliensis Pb18]ODH19204.1 hypothetical protein ACO22_06183 [Paracoccidioides brasiliensis]ODH52101.1 hypothetical protein GX48_01654 [Paracoccidioides brasiliensis]